MILEVFRLCGWMTGKAIDMQSNLMMEESNTRITESIN